MPRAKKIERHPGKNDYQGFLTVAHMKLSRGVLQTLLGYAALRARGDNSGPVSLKIERWLEDLTALKIILPNKRLALKPHQRG